MRRLRVLFCGSCLAVAVVSACAAFDDAGEPGPTPTVTPDGAAEASANDVTVSDPDAAEPACVPEAIEPVDSGVAEDAACGPGEQQASLAVAQDHCGFCGNSCGENTCAGGACQGKVVTSSPESTIFGATTSTHLYFATNASSCASTATLRRLSLAGGVVEDVFAEDAGCIAGLALDQDRLYYLNRPSGIHIMSSSDAGPTAPVTTTPPNSLYAMHLGPTRLFWRDVYGQSVTAAQKDGSNPIVVYEDGAATVHELIGDGDDVWWIAGPAGADAGGADEKLWRYRPGASATTRQTNLTQIRALAVDATHVFLASTTGEVFRVRKDDASAAELVTKIDVVDHWPRAMAVVGGYVFVAVGGVTNVVNSPFDLYRVKKCGGRPRRIATGHMFGPALFAANDRLYYSDVGVMRSFEITKR